MQQQLLTIKLPSSVQLTQFELTMMLAAKMYERGILSAGQAAEVAGISKRTFVELLGKYGVSVFGYSSLEELESVSHPGLGAAKGNLIEMTGE